MTRPAAVLMSMCLCAAMFSSGCTMLRQTWNTVFDLHDSEDPEVGGDQWAVAGKEGRGNRRMEKEDPLDRLLWSQKARDINRNMGFE
jgi:hypothetical protein